jgi:hypothetical protein
MLTGHIEFVHSEAADGDVRGVRIVRFRSVLQSIIACHRQPPIGSAAEAEELDALSIATAWWMRAGDFVILQVYQNTGGALNLVSTVAAQTGHYSPEFTITRVP